MDLSMAVWRKSRRSGSNGGGCVDVASNLPGLVAVRDSKQPTGAVLRFDPASFRTFLADLKHSRYDPR